MLFRKLYPATIAESAFTIDYKKLYNKGYRGLVFDIDNTLVEHGAPADFRATELFRRLKKIGFAVCLVSNNKEKRVAGFAGQVGAGYISNANKPSRKGFLKAIRLMRTSERSTISIGDQLFTDIYGANRTGIHSILVKPIAKKEEIQIILKRYLERIVLFFYKRQTAD